MATFVSVTGIISVCIGWLVTARLFALSRRSGGTPERLLATAFGGLFCVGYPLAGFSRAPGLTGTHEGALIFTIGAIGMVVGIAALNRFPQLVFRPDRRWAAVVSTLATLGGSVAGLGCVVSVASADSRAEMITSIQPWALGLMGSIGIPFLWNAIESSLYYRSMKKRLALGLAQPETTHRFLLWALASWCSVAQVAAVFVIRASGLPILAPLPMGIIAFSSLFASICWWLAFCMPETYRSRVLGQEDPRPARGD